VSQPGLEQPRHGGFSSRQRDPMNEGDHLTQTVSPASQGSRACAEPCWCLGGCCGWLLRGCRGGLQCIGQAWLDLGTQRVGRQLPAELQTPLSTTCVTGRKKNQHGCLRSLLRVGFQGQSVLLRLLSKNYTSLTNKTDGKHASHLSALGSPAWNNGILGATQPRHEHWQC
jgi:hypothetical protein